MKLGNQTLTLVVSMCWDALISPSSWDQIFSRSTAMEWTAGQKYYEFFFIYGIFLGMIDWVVTGHTKHEVLLGIANGALNISVRSKG